MTQRTRTHRVPGMIWQHEYIPLGGLWISTALATGPFALLCWQLLVRRKPGHVAALTALTGALILATMVWKMPIGSALHAMAYGSAFGAFPILWIVLGAMWVYNLTVDSGQFAVVRDSISSLTPDRRIQAIFIAFSFGSLLESTAGYGSPVAICGAMLIGLGFAPLQAALLCLLANTVPVAYAGMGLPAVVAGQVSDLDAFRISQIIGTRLPVLTVFLPLWLSVVVCGWKRSFEIWPVLLAAGLGSAIPTWLFAWYHGYTLPGIMGSIGSLLSTAIVVRCWKPKQVFLFASDTRGPGTAVQHSASVIVRAWFAWILLAMLVICSTAQPVRALLDSLFYARFPWPGLHGFIFKAAPLAPAGEAVQAMFTFNLASSPGTIIVLTGLLLPLLNPGYGYRNAMLTLRRTLFQMRYSVLTVLLILALAQLLNFSGMSYTLGLALTATGSLFVALAPLLGWFGVFLTGSDTSSNALFCGMQRATAEAVGIDPYLAVAANSTGGVTAKMISPQSLAVAGGATGTVGQEGVLLRRTIGHSLLMLFVVSLLAWLQTNVLSFMIY